MYKVDLVLNNQQWLICHKTKPRQTIYPQMEGEYLDLYLSGGY